MPAGGVERRRVLRIASYRAERAAALFLNVPFERDPNGFGKPDVGGYQVRMSQAGEPMPIYRGDEKRGHPFLHVTASGDDLVFHVRGMIECGRAFALWDRGVGRVPRSRTGWYIPPDQLVRVGRGAGAYQGSAS